MKYSKLREAHANAHKWAGAWIYILAPYAFIWLCWSFVMWQLMACYDWYQFIVAVALSILTIHAVSWGIRE